MNQDLLESLLSPVSEASPAGQDLEYDADFMALDRAATTKGERAIGDAVKAAVEPEWDKVVVLALGLLGRSKDLRVAVHLGAAWTRIHGLPGWSGGLALIRGLLETYWDGVHPQLDAEDDNDPTARVNAVVPVGDPLGVLSYFRTTPFVQSPRVGRFSLRDLRIANGSLKLGDDATGLPTMTDIEACCMDCPEDQLLQVAQAVSDALEHAKAIDAIFSDQVGTAGPELRPLLSDTFELKKFLDAQVAKRMPQTVEDAAESGANDEPGGGTSTAVAAGSGRISSPQDVLRRIDELCEYYARNEPSSPVPLLLRRAQRLVGLNFFDLLKDLAPGGISELRTISGSEEGG